MDSSVDTRQPPQVSPQPGTETLSPGQVRDPELLSTNEMRQGVTGFGLRYILALSTAGALIALVIAWLVIAH